MQELDALAVRQFWIFSRDSGRKILELARLLHVDHVGDHARVGGGHGVQRRLAPTGDDDGVAQLVEGLGEPTAYTGTSARDQNCVIPVDVHGSTRP
jgi:hypothetical protein